MALPTLAKSYNFNVNGAVSSNHATFWYRLKEALKGFSPGWTVAGSAIRVDVVHNGDNFAPLYGPKSARFVVPGGFRYRVLRVDGWPSGPTITAYAIDPTGNENG